MPDAIRKIAAAVAKGADTGAGLRIAKVTALEPGGARVRLDITGDTWVAVDADVRGLAVAERVYALQQGPVAVVSGRLVQPPPAPVPITVPVGGIVPYAGSSATIPDGWLLCDGASLSRTTFADLFAVVGTTYGSTASTFRVPNLTGRFPLGDDATTTLGEVGGAATVTLTSANLPAHTHGSEAGHTHVADVHTHASQTVAAGTGATVSDTPVAATDTTTSGGGHTHTSVGGDAAHENMPPYIALHYIIRAKVAN